jgi:hypothetical protein
MAFSLLRETCCFKGGHCILHIHGDETRRIPQTWMESIGMKVWPSAELLAPALEKARAGASLTRLASVSFSQGGGVSDFDGTTDRGYRSSKRRC